MSKCEHGLTSAECFVCASPKYGAPPVEELLRQQCASCEHRHYPDGGWCYMFREPPQGVCMKHKPEAQQEQTK